MSISSLSAFFKPGRMLHRTAARLTGVPGARVPEGGGGLRLAQFLTRLSECRSRRAEQRIVQEELARLRGVLSENEDAASLRDALLSATYCHLLGYSVTEFMPYAATLVQRAERAADKRAGYMLAALLLSGNNDLALMLVNGLLKDLKSRDEVCVVLALGALVCLVDADIASAVTPTVVHLLGHSSDTVRKRALVVLERVDVCAPHQLVPYRDAILALLDDPEAGVVYAAVGILTRFAQRERLEYQPMAVQLAQILRIVAGGRLAEEHDYHGVPAPWFQMRLLRLLAHLLYDEAALSEQVLPDILFALERAQAGIDAAFAVVYECVRTLTRLPLAATLYANSAARPFEAPVRFLRSRNANLRCLGLRMLGEIVRVEPGQAEEHQTLLISCLDAEDVNLRKLTLDLLYEVTTAHNVMVVVNKMLESMQTCRTSRNHTWHAELAERIVVLALRLSPSADWFARTVVSVLQEPRNAHAQVVKNATMERIMHFIGQDGASSGLLTGDALQIACADALAAALEGLLDGASNAKQKSRDTRDFTGSARASAGSQQLFELTVWVLGEYGHRASRFSLDRLLALLVQLYSTHANDRILQCQLTMSICKLALRLLRDGKPSKSAENDVMADVRRILRTGATAAAPELRTLCVTMGPLLDSADCLEDTFPTGSLFGYIDTSVFFAAASEQAARAHAAGQLYYDPSLAFPPMVDGEEDAGADQVAADALAADASSADGNAATAACSKSKKTLGKLRVEAYAAPTTRDYIRAARRIQTTAATSHTAVTPTSATNASTPAAMLMPAGELALSADVAAVDSAT
ncbi:adaptin N terminal region-domain-containing protein [Thamnocephalis sphaerospora]|uniref:Adaptin N terminal region-domain-containing protein n=1 Tax=Thamnocephalis sphaerospora TaxID=78915 RepID=A0A4V1IW24_9FUNG|nr:adaptin N terminal region-domain-containing protein [Thamnocephalis sphaerospora]|eukprot:RKP06069.1 adaptin N terminal region-domain-containing protein [Thamnocephalis sphaerospora]